MQVWLTECDEGGITDNLRGDEISYARFLQFLG